MNTEKFEKIWEFVFNTLFYFQNNWLALAAFVLSTLSLWITWRKNLKDRHYANDKELIEQLKLSLELAFKSIASKDNDGPPTNIRFRWLAAARHIARYRELQLSLKTSFYRTICEEHEEYWRNEVHSLLSRIDSSDFFGCVSEKMDMEFIDIRSAAVVYSFSVWKEGRPDPLDAITLEDIILKYGLNKPYFRHYWGYVARSAPELAKKVNSIGGIAPKKWTQS